MGIWDGICIADGDRHSHKNVETCIRYEMRHSWQGIDWGYTDMGVPLARATKMMKIRRIRNWDVVVSVFVRLIGK